MCGIIFIKSKNTIDQKKIKNSISDIIARGPDYQKKYVSKDKKIFLLNSVLQITGEEREKKFKITNNKKIILAFNGQIYNFKILGRKYLSKDYKNDTEFLIDFIDKYSLKNALKKIDGMFSILIYDKNQNKIIIANDPQGEKRIFYYKDKNELIISSTPFSILKYLKNKNFLLNFQEFKNYFCTRHFINFKKFSFFNINILNPGKIAEVNLNNFSVKTYFFENPLNWIREEKYLKYNEMSKNKFLEKIRNLFQETATNICSNLKTGCTISAGIDSSLSAGFLNNIKKQIVYLCLQFGQKDKIALKIQNFQKYLEKKIYVKNILINKHKITLKKIYLKYLMPFFTHDYVARYETANFFNKKKVKVYFVSDCADELFGGYSLYKKLKNNPISPYSNVHELSSQKKEYNNFFKKVEKKYNFIKDDKKRKIMTSLFLDYFYQSVSVTNLSNDLIGSSFGLEVRNIFSRKKIIQCAINIPLSKKFYLNNKFELKPILKSLFKNFFSKKLIYKKQGLSGYPNEMVKYADSKKLILLSKYFPYKIYGLKKHAYDWKILNLYFYFKYLNEKKINYYLKPNSFLELIRSF